MEIIDKVEDILSGFGIKSRAEKWADKSNFRELEY